MIDLRQLVAMMKIRNSLTNLRNPLQRVRDHQIDRFGRGMVAPIETVRLSRILDDLDRFSCFLDRWEDDFEVDLLQRMNVAVVNQDRALNRRDFCLGSFSMLVGVEFGRAIHRRRPH